jgi:hypothetical protein
MQRSKRLVKRYFKDKWGGKQDQIVAEGCAFGPVDSFFI